MIAVYYFGTGICCALVGMSDSFETLAIALFGVGLFAAIYHPVGTPMVVDAAVTRGRTMAFNGICGNIGVSIASVFTAVIADTIGWLYTFLIPAVGRITACRRQAARRGSPASRALGHLELSVQQRPVAGGTAAGRTVRPLGCAPGSNG